MFFANTISYIQNDGWNPTEKCTKNQKFRFSELTLVRDFSFYKRNQTGSTTKIIENESRGIVSRCKQTERSLI